MVAVSIADAGQIKVSQVKFDQMQLELETLKETRVGIRQTLNSTSHGFGGELVDNGEWQGAMLDLADVDGRISQLEKQMNAAVIVHNGNVHQCPIVGIGATVYMRDLITNQELSFEIVGPLETNPMDHKIGLDCPLGEKICGQKIGTYVTYTTPRGEERRVQITAIRYE